MAVFDGVIPAIVGAANAAAADNYEIERSLRFNSADTARLSRTMGTFTDINVGTISFWVKRSALGAGVIAAGWTGSTLYSGSIQFNSTDNALQVGIGGGAAYLFKTNALLTDDSAWYHVVAAWDRSASATDKVKVWINGVAQTSSDTGYQSWTSGDCQIWASNNSNRIGRGDGDRYDNLLNGYLAEYHYVDGQALDESNFGEFDGNNNWNPKEYEGTYGNEGFYLKFDDNSSTAALGTDSSGNSNTWTVNNFSVASGSDNDSLIDTPTNYEAGSGNNGGNYATLSTSDNAGVTLSNGSLEVATSGWQSFKATIGVTSGKWYWESQNKQTAAAILGVATEQASVFPNGSIFGSTGHSGGDSNPAWTWAGANYYFNATSAGTGLSNHSASDIVMYALDLDNGKLWFGRNGTWYDSSWGTTGNPSTGANATVSGLNTTYTYLPAGSIVSAGAIYNFGQRPFDYTPPTGFLSLCTQNLPDPTIAEGSTAFNAAIWTGDGTSGRNIPTGHSSDLVWLKRRDTTNNFSLTDIIRGVNVNLRSSTNGAETTDANSLTGFDTDGFTVGSDSAFNGSGGTFVGWSWDAGSSTGSNTDGTVTSQVRVNQTAGFSIVSYTGTETNGDSVGHGLSATPEFFILKSRDGARDWLAYNTVIDGSLDFLVLNTTAGKLNSNANDPTSSVFYLFGTDANALNEDYIAYCWTPVEGFSAFGSYTGNGSADGPFIYTGFAPRWVLFKRTDTSGDSWTIFDTARDINPLNVGLEPNSSAAEQTYGNRQIDTKGNGFRVTSSGSSSNANNGIYVYAAFAEHPFKTSRGQ